MPMKRSSLNISAAISAVKVAAGEVIDDHRQAHARHDVVVILADSVI